VRLTGLLGERLLSGRPSLARALAAARRLYAGAIAQGGMAVSGDAEAPLAVRVALSADGDVLLRCRLPARLGAAAALGAPGLPLTVRFELRLQLDGASGRVREVRIEAVSVNGRPLLPRVLSDLVRGAAPPGGGADPGGGGFEAVLASLAPWLREPTS